ncbi:trp operon leader peptide [Enterobacter chuandaensis]|nr:trp operon leader peptide [Enterobacter cloacae complex sp. P31C]
MTAHFTLHGWWRTT